MHTDDDEVVDNRQCVSQYHDTIEGKRSTDDDDGRIGCSSLHKTRPTEDARGARLDVSRSGVQQIFSRQCAKNVKLGPTGGVALEGYRLLSEEQKFIV